MGNPEFSVPSLSELVRSQHQILSVITNVDTQQGRGRKLRSTAVADYSERNGIPVFKTESLKLEKTVEYLKSLDLDLFVIVAYKILPKSLLKIPYYGSVNLHGSLLPKYRGAAPIQWALMNGDSSTGLTTFFLKPSIDTGDIVLQKKVVIFPDDDFRTLSSRMAVIGALLVRKTVSIIRAGKVMVIPQDNTQATKAPKITPEFCQIDWHRSSINIHNQVRGLSPIPCAYTHLWKKRLKIFKTRISGEKNISPGKVSAIRKNEFTISCGTGSLDILEVQYEGKRRMPIASFLQGVEISIGEQMVD